MSGQELDQLLIAWRPSWRPKYRWCQPDFIQELLSSNSITAFRKKAGFPKSNEVARRNCDGKVTAKTTLRSLFDQCTSLTLAYALRYHPRYCQLLCEPYGASRYLPMGTYDDLGTPTGNAWKMWKDTLKEYEAEAWHLAVFGHIHLPSHENAWTISKETLKWYFSNWFSPSIRSVKNCAANVWYLTQLCYYHLHGHENAWKILKDALKSRGVRRMYDTWLSSAISLATCPFCPERSDFDGECSEDNQGNTGEVFAVVGCHLTRLRSLRFSDVLWNPSGKCL